MYEFRCNGAVHRKSRRLTAGTCRQQAQHGAQLLPAIVQYASVYRVKQLDITVQHTPELVLEKPPVFSKKIFNLPYIHTCRVYYEKPFKTKPPFEVFTGRPYASSFCPTRQHQKRNASESSNPPNLASSKTSATVSGRLLPKLQQYLPDNWNFHTSIPTPSPIPYSQRFTPSQTFF